MVCKWLMEDLHTITMTVVMNTYIFETFDIGLSESFEVQITEEMIHQFRLLSGDENPMHIDKQYAQEHGYESKLVYGMLTASFYSKLAGMYLPGQYCILKSVESFFERPVYVGDTLKITGKVKEKDDRFFQATVKAKITNQDGKTVSKANILVGFYE